MTKVDFGALAHLQDRWRNDPGIPRWKKDGMVGLVDKLRQKVSDNHYNLDGIELYFPEDCNNYDVFMSVSYALDALVIPRSNGCCMREFGKYDENFGIE